MLQIFIASGGLWVYPIRYLILLSSAQFEAYYSHKDEERKCHAQQRG